MCLILRSVTTRTIVIRKYEDKNVGFNDYTKREIPSLTLK